MISSNLHSPEQDFKNINIICTSKPNVEGWYFKHGYINKSGTPSNLHRPNQHYEDIKMLFPFEVNMEG